MSSEKIIRLKIPGQDLFITWHHQTSPRGQGARTCKIAPFFGLVYMQRIQ